MAASAFFKTDCCFAFSKRFILENKIVCFFAHSIQKRFGNMSRGIGKELRERKEEQ